MVRTVSAIGLVLAVLMTGCTPGPDRAVLTVFAAASLTEVFGTLEQQFAREHPEVEIRMNFAGSARLGHQLAEGAQADVFVSADPHAMDVVAGAGRIAEVTTFARNTLAIAVPPTNPDGITGLADLASQKARAVICAEQVPCGRAIRQLAANRGVALDPVSEELSVKSVLQKVVLGEADAGVVYRTDVLAADEAVDAVAIDGASTVTNEYLFGVLADTTQTDLAQQFQRHVLSQQGQATLAQAGFGAADE